MKKEDAGKKGMMADRICSLLALRRMKQKDLARAAGISDASVSLYINKGRVPKGHALFRIASALGTRPQYLTGETDVHCAAAAADDVAEIRRIILRSRALMTEGQKCGIAALLFCGGKSDGEIWQE